MGAIALLTEVSKPVGRVSRIDRWGVWGHNRRRAVNRVSARWRSHHVGREAGIAHRSGLEEAGAGGEAEAGGGGKAAGGGAGGAAAGDAAGAGGGGADGGYGGGGDGGWYRARGGGAGARGAGVAAGERGVV